MRTIKAFAAAFCLLGYHFAAHADIGNGLIHHMEWARQKTRGANQCLENTATTPTQNDEVANLCMTQICGTADQVYTSEKMAIALMRDPKLVEATSKNAVDIVTGINQMIDESTKEKILTVEAYRDLKKRNDLTPLPSFQRLHDLTAMLDELKRASFEPGPSPQMPMVVDRKATLEKFSDLSQDQRQWAVDNIDHFARSSIGSDLMLQNTTDPRDFLKMKYPSLSFRDALKTEGLMIQRTTANLLNGPNGSMVRSIAGATKSLTDPVIKKAANGEEMTDSEVSQFMNLRASAPIIDDVLSPKAQGGQTVLLTGASREALAQFIARTKFDEHVTQYERDLKDPQRVQEKRNVAYQSCLTGYVFQMATLPSQPQIQIAEKNGNWAKSKIKEILGPVLSVQTKQMLNAKIDKSFFAMPRNRESFHRFFMDELKAEAANAADRAKDYRALIDSGQHKSVTLLNIHQNSDRFSIDNHFQEAQKFCDDFKIKLTSDNAFTSTGNIETSWVSARKPEFGKAVMLHELGHIASKSLASEAASTESRGHFNGIEKCLANNHSEAGATGQYVNEDFSDLMAGKGAGRENTNIGCELSDQEDNQYTNLNLDDPKADDVHSTKLFRALNFYKIQNGKLPSACNQFIESQGKGWKFDSCF